MTCTLQFDPFYKLILTTYTDPVGDEFLETYRQLGNAVIATGARCGITDFSSVNEFKISSDDVKLLAVYPTNFPDPMPRCIVASSDYLYGMWRMFQMAGGATRSNLYVVRSMEEALQLLGITPPLRYQPVDPQTGKLMKQGSAGTQGT